MAAFETFTDLADPSSEPLFPPGSAVAWWYRSGEVYSVVYTGVDVDLVGSTCPETVLENPDGTQGFGSLAPLSEGDCGADEGLLPAALARRCEDMIVITTLIPSDAEGSLIAGFGAGLNPKGGASVATADPSATPELDAEADAYAFPASMGGPVTC